MMLLPTVLSLIAGSCDIISFTGLGGLFTAHITGNLVVLLARVVAGENARISYMLSVPVFIAAPGLTRLPAGGLERIGMPSLRRLLMLQFLLLAAFQFFGLAIDSPVLPGTATAVFAGMLGVSAMAVQNALEQISIKGAPSTAVMTTDLARFMLDSVDALIQRDRDQAAKSAARAKQTAPAIMGFAVGCGLGAGCEVAGMWSLALPTGLALVALGIGFTAERDGEP
jgi:uncharacterized membrane protein YoaK (UPF0700 family)